MQHIVMFIGLPGCQPAGSKVLLASGKWKNIEDIVYGDLVLSPQQDGSVSVESVINTSRHTNKKVFEIKTSGKKNNISYKASGDHILPILTIPHKKINRKAKYYKSIVEQVSIIDYLKWSKLKRNKSRLFLSPAFNLPEIKHPLHPYAVGVLLGDGCLTQHTPQITSVDIDIINCLLSLGIDLGKIRRNKKRPHIYEVSLIGKSGHFSRSILGHPNSHNKKIPEQYLLSSLEQRLWILAGLIDTDGSKDEFSTTSLQLAKDFQYLVRSVGGVATIKNRYTKYERDHDAKKFLSYRVHFYFAEYIPPIQLKRKRPLPRNMLWKNPRNRNFTVSYHSNEDVYGFTISGKSNWYITDNWIVTHNSGKSHFSNKYAKKGYVIVSLDALVLMCHNGQYSYRTDYGELYRDLYISSAHEAIRSGKNVVLDGTHLSKRVRQYWIRYCKGKSKIDAICWLPNIKNNLYNRGRNGRGFNKEYWKEVIERMFALYERPSKSEGFKSLIFKRVRKY